MKHKFTFFMFLSALWLFLLSFASAQVPANDECAGAFSVGTLPYSYSQNTRLATPNAGDPGLPCSDGGHGKTVWFKFTPDTTRIYTISTRNSSPSTYDVALGVFTGSCGSLTLIECSDDIVPGSTRQAEITAVLDSGVTYTIHVAEWNGGGASGGVPTGGDLVFEVYQDTLKPLYAGPKSGSVPSGAIANTGAFANIRPVISPEKQVVKNLPDAPLIQTQKGVTKPTGKAGSNLYNSKGEKITAAASISQPVVLANFEGMDPTGFIPPDPICAVGPNHVITMVNSTFRIYTKSGTLEHEIPMSSWFSNVKSPVGFSDPQVFYDHFENRWVMAGGGFSEPYTFLISVSDDDDPNGIWYNWSLPGGLGDSTTGNLPDYPQMGYDDEAIYISSNDFNPGLLYSRVRIIPKAQLYTGSAGSVTWFDVWDFRDPEHRTVPTTSIRPSIVFGHPGVHFLVNSAPYNPGTFITVWKVINGATSPELTATNIPVVEYYTAPNADQPGPTTDVLLEAGGSAIRHKAVYRDSSLWIAHSIAKDSGSLFSALRYARLDPFADTAKEDVAMGDELTWRFYPSLMVDGNKNLVITYTESNSSTEYPGLYIAGRKEGDPPGLSPSVVVKAGEGHYELLGSGRNRWGDYSGAALDPNDSLSVWVNGEYATSNNNWSTWVAQVKLSPVSGKYLYGTPLAKNFGSREVGTISDTFSVALRNFGEDPVQISDISEPTANFDVVGLPSMPYTLAIGETLVVKIIFTPQDTGAISSTVTITSDDDDRSPMTVNISGDGYNITDAQASTMYLGSGSTDGGKLYTISPTTAAPSLIGYSEFSQIVSLAVHPTTHELWGLVPYAASFYLVRINTEFGDAHFVSLINLPALKGMTFLNDSTVYVGRINGRLYRVNIYSGAATEVANTGIVLAGLALNPVTGKLWASVRNTVGADNIYKINLPGGSATLVGATGFGQQTPDIAFDQTGNLFGLIGSSSQFNRLILIDTTSGAGTSLGDIGKSNMQAIAFGPGNSFTTTTYRMKSAWNMISLPLSVTNNALSAVLPSPASEAFSYNGNYYSGTTLENGKGYWVKFASAKTHMIMGSPSTVDTVDVLPKWNMIGSMATKISASAVQALAPVHITSNFYWYNPDSGYVISNFIEPAKSYFVKTDSAGQLVFNTSFAAKNIAQEHGIDLQSLNTLTVSDNSSHTQTLYFGERGFENTAVEKYELPPSPPTGMFDARFSSNSLVALHRAQHPEETIPVVVSAKEYPVTLQWNTSHSSRAKYYIVVKDEEGTTSETLMKENGKVVLANAASTIRIRIEENMIPEAFALRQNYPNPFNPSTVIRYEIPVDAHVKLSVFDVLGREIMTLVNQTVEAGVYDVTFDASNVASGVYFYSVTAEPLDGSTGFSRYQSINKMLLMK